MLKFDKIINVWQDQLKIKNKKDIKQRWTKLETRRLIQHFNIEGVRQGIDVDTCVAHWTFGGFSYHILKQNKGRTN